jgi:glycosyltransferase involved in cell wall biosynthesis
LIFTKYKKLIENFIQIDNDKIQSSVVIVGCARNIASKLDKTIEIIKMIKNCFIDYQIIIYENDSTDDTLDKLNKWSKEDNKVEIITEKNVPGLRTQRLSHARNTLMKKALTHNSEFIVSMDLDLVNHNLTKESFMSSFLTDIDWAAIFANQSEKYYDLWALRSIDNWLNFDCIKCLHKTKDDDYCRGSRIKKINSNEKPIEVLSAFGGLGIYKTKYLKNAESQSRK